MTINEAFWKIHNDLPRQAPGSVETTAKLFAVATKDRQFQTAIDMGCGPGRSTLFIAEKGLDVVAIDTHDHFLDELQTAAKQQNLTDRITAKHMAMEAVDYPDASFDVVWAESTAYLIGWREALIGWKRLLKPNGKIVATDCFWITNNRSPEAIAFWESDGEMKNTVEQAERIARECGYSIDMIYIQPDSDWFIEYYDPMEQRLAELRLDADPEMQEAIRMTEEEIDVRRRYGDEYAHVGFVLSVVG